MKLKNVFGIILFAFCISIFLSCSDNDDDEIPDYCSVKFTKIGQSSLSGTGWEGISKSNLIITNETDWQNLLDKMDIVSPITGLFTETTIDFDRYQVIVVIQDIRQKAWEVEINGIVQNKNTMIVSTKEIDLCLFTFGTTQPFCIVKLPKTNKKILFLDEIL